MHLCAELIAVSMLLEPLGEVGANFSLQLLSRTQFTKINNKKVIAENQCEKHKKSSLTWLARAIYEILPQQHTKVVEESGTEPNTIVHEPQTKEKPTL